MTEDQEMMDILQSFIDLAEPKLDKYKELEKDVKATKWAINKINEFKKELDYYKQRHLEFNDFFIKNNMNMEQMLKDLKRSKLYEKGGNI